MGKPDSWRYLVVNINEGYSNLTLKMMVAFKFVFCFCPNAAYLVKSDDDNYLLMEKLENAITKEQQKVDLEMQHGFRRSGEMYLGWSPKFRHIQRKGIWAVSFEEYDKAKYPAYHTGALYVLTIPAVCKIASDCPLMCTRLDPLAIKNKEKLCLWKFEDVFLGSCLHFTQKNTYL